MKVPCEVIVGYVFPFFRRELAVEMAALGAPQADIAKIFGQTDAAISQYIKGKRGCSELIEKSDKRPMMIEAIRESARSLVACNSSFQYEMCRLCNVAAEIGLLAELYETIIGEQLILCPSFGRCMGDITQ